MALEAGYPSILLYRDLIPSPFLPHCLHACMYVYKFYTAASQSDDGY
jgi:hypothetical protein